MSHDDFSDYPIEDAQWQLIPAYMREGIYEYVMTGRPVGSFLSAIIKDESISTVWALADESNRRQIGGWMTFLYNYFPAEAKGSSEKMHRWASQGGYRGRES